MSTLSCHEFLFHCQDIILYVSSYLYIIYMLLCVLYPVRPCSTLTLSAGTTTARVRATQFCGFWQFVRHCWHSVSEEVPSSLNLSNVVTPNVHCLVSSVLCPLSSIRCIFPLQLFRKFFVEKLLQNFIYFIKQLILIFRNKTKISILSDQKKKENQSCHIYSVDFIKIFTDIFQNNSAIWQFDLFPN